MKLEANREVQQLRDDGASTSPSDHERLMKAAGERGTSVEGKSDDRIRQKLERAQK